jgi:DNA-directed RNA polymerase specialized sigma24 family protein
MKLDGFTNEEIASRLSTTTRTVERDLQRIRQAYTKSQKDRS